MCLFSASGSQLETVIFIRLGKFLCSLQSNSSEPSGRHSEGFGSDNEIEKKKMLRKATMVVSKFRGLNEREGQASFLAPLNVFAKIL